ncbi:MAG: FAD-dependent oxidoreductase [Candidatus Babeliales bacterium]
MTMSNRVLIFCALAAALSLGIVGIVKTKKTKAEKYALKAVKSLKNVVPLLISGSGAAGGSAALYGSRSDLKTIVIGGEKPGGALTETSYIENWPGRVKVLGSKLMDDLHEQAKSFGAEFLNDTVLSIDCSEWPYTVKTEGGLTLRVLALIYATGSTPRTLGIPGEKEFWGRGVTTCAICDAPFCKGYDVAVVGGGDTAAEEAMQLAPYAKHITILVRGSAMRASAAMQERLKEYPNIAIAYHKEVKKINGTDGHVSSIDVLDNQSNTMQTMPIRGFFLAIGHDPNVALVKDCVALDKEGYVALDSRSQRTSVPFIYAAGDVADKHYKQAGVAAGDAIKAALDALADLQELGYSTKFAKSIEKNFFSPSQAEAKEVALVSSVSEFEKIMMSSDAPVILDFFAEYCPSCMRMIPVVESVAFELGNDASFYKADMEQAQELARTYNVESIPTLLVFKKGKLVGRYTEAMNKSQLHETAKKHIEN